VLWEADYTRNAIQRQVKCPGQTLTHVTILPTAPAYVAPYNPLYTRASNSCPLDQDLHTKSQGFSILSGHECKLPCHPTQPIHQPTSTLLTPAPAFSTAAR
jgi:hypothetical protein